MSSKKKEKDAAAANYADMQCPSCGTMISVGSNFCGHCGYKLQLDLGEERCAFFQHVDNLRSEGPHSNLLAPIHVDVCRRMWTFAA